MSETGHRFIKNPGFLPYQESADDNRRLLGYGRVKELEPKPPLKQDAKARKRLAALLVNYHEFEPALSFEDIGGDPRTNFTNSITRIDFNFMIIPVERLLLLSMMTSLKSNIMPERLEKGNRSLERHC